MLVDLSISQSLSLYRLSESRLDILLLFRRFARLFSQILSVLLWVLAGWSGLSFTGSIYVIYFQYCHLYISVALSYICGLLSIDLIYMLYWFRACSVISLLASSLVYYFAMLHMIWLYAYIHVWLTLVCRKIFKSSRFRLSPYFQHGFRVECVVRASVAAWWAYADRDSEGLCSIAQLGRVSSK